MKPSMKPRRVRALARDIFNKERTIPVVRKTTIPHTTRINIPTCVLLNSSVKTIIESIFKHPNEAFFILGPVEDEEACYPKDFLDSNEMYRYIMFKKPTAVGFQNCDDDFIIWFKMKYL